MQMSLFVSCRVNNTIMLPIFVVFFSLLTDKQTRGSRSRKNYKTKNKKVIGSFIHPSSKSKYVGNLTEAAFPFSLDKRCWIFFFPLKGKMYLGKSQ